MEQSTEHDLMEQIKKTSNLIKKQHSQIHRLLEMIQAISDLSKPLVRQEERRNKQDQEGQGDE